MEWPGKRGLKTFGVANGLAGAPKRRIYRAAARWGWDGGDYGSGPLMVRRRKRGGSPPRSLGRAVNLLAQRLYVIGGAAALARHGDAGLSQ